MFYIMALTAAGYTGCGRMDSHISNGKKKTNETSYRKKLYILEKYLQSSFFPPIRF
jgi:hypothetical protein